MRFHLRFAISAPVTGTALLALLASGCKPTPVRVGIGRASVTMSRDTWNTVAFVMVGLVLVEVVMLAGMVLCKMIDAYRR